MRNNIQKCKLREAIRKYTEGSVSLGKAVKIADLPKRLFMYKLQEMGIRLNISKNDFIKGMETLTKPEKIMKKKPMDKDWEAFSDWERTYKRKALKALTVDSAFALFSELWEAQTKLPANEIEKFRERKIEELIMLRKSFNLIQKRLHA